MHVEMNRNLRAPCLTSLNFLYARGDEPACEQEAISLVRIFSTHVEMNRYDNFVIFICLDFLYARGDEPTMTIIRFGI